VGVERNQHRLPTWPSSDGLSRCQAHCVNKYSSGQQAWLAPARHGLLLGDGCGTRTAGLWRRIGVSSNLPSARSPAATEADCSMRPHISFPILHLAPANPRVGRQCESCAHWPRKADAAIEQLSERFVDGRKRKRRGADAEDREALYAEIGRLKFELDWLKKSWTARGARRLLVDPAMRRSTCAGSANR